MLPPVLNHNVGTQRVKVNSNDLREIIWPFALLFETCNNLTTIQLPQIQIYWGIEEKRKQVI